MQLRLNQVAFGLAHGVLGATPNRMGVWTQGCSLPKCRGCASRHTWSANGGKAVAVYRLIALAEAQPRTPSGLTISGGEPTDQAAAVMHLIKRFRSSFADGEVILYSGLRWAHFRRRFPELLSELDVLVSGPYVRTKEATPLTGSTNQDVHLLTPKAEHLYRDWQSWDIHQVQVASLGSDRLVTVGIPNIPSMHSVARRIGASDETWTETENSNVD